MYAIYGNIYHQYTPNVSIYTSTMDPMGTDHHFSAQSHPSPTAAFCHAQTTAEVVKPRHEVAKTSVFWRVARMLRTC